MKMIRQDPPTVVFGHVLDGSVGTLDVQSGRFVVLHGADGLGEPIDMPAIDSFVFVNDTCVSWLRHGKVEHVVDLPTDGDWFESVLSVNGTAFVQTDVDGSLFIRDIETDDTTHVGGQIWCLVDSVFATHGGSRLFAASFQDSSWGVVEVKLDAHGKRVEGPVDGKYDGVAISSPNSVAVRSDAGLSLFLRSDANGSFVELPCGFSGRDGVVQCSIESQTLLVQSGTRVHQFTGSLSGRSVSAVAYELEPGQECLVGCGSGIVVRSGDCVEFVVPVSS
ncbi:MAG: hypothetical protein R3B40_24455 [Polyangiales bacterium]